MALGMGGVAVGGDAACLGGFDLEAEGDHAIISTRAEGLWRGQPGLKVMHASVYLRESEAIDSSPEPCIALVRMAVDFGGAVCEFEHTR